MSAPAFATGASLLPELIVITVVSGSESASVLFTTRLAM